MRILGLDLATNTGWAFIGDSVQVAGVQCFKAKFGESTGMLFLKFASWLEEVATLPRYRPELIAYEQAHQRGRAATQVCVGLVAHSLSFAAKHKIETYPVPSMTLKKWATGKGNAGKPEMIAAALGKFGLDCVPGFERKTTCDDNIADAWLLAQFAKEKFETR